MAALFSASIADVFCAIRQSGNIFFTHKYFLNGDAIELEPPHTFPALCASGKYQLLGKIPIKTDLIDTLQHKFKKQHYASEERYLGMYLNSEQPMIVDVVICSQLGRGTNIELLMHDQNIQQIINYGFICKYFPLKQPHKQL